VETACQTPFSFVATDSEVRKISGVDPNSEFPECDRSERLRLIKHLRAQTRSAIEQFIQTLLDDPANRPSLRAHDTDQRAAKQLWHDALILVYQLLLRVKVSGETDAADLWSESGLKRAAGPFGAGGFLLRLEWNAKAVSALREGLSRQNRGSLGVEDIGHVYEGLLELAPGIAGEAMCRLRRKKLELVVPESQGAQYQKKKRGEVEWIERIPAGQFHLRTGLGRKTSGSYYTPSLPVRFLVRETIGPLIAERSSDARPDPRAILGIKVLDPAMGSGHFLIEACRFMGERLYEACCRCGDALEFEIDVLDREKGLAQCRRLVAEQCLYGVDKNPLAVELARMSLAFESRSEGEIPAGLREHLVLGDALTGPSFPDLLTYPGTQEQVSVPLQQRLTDCFARAIKQPEKDSLLPFKVLAAAWAGGVMLGERGCDDGAYHALLENVAAGRLPENATAGLLRMVSKGLGVSAPRSRDLAALLDDDMQAPALSYDLAFPAVFFPDGNTGKRGGFDAIIGNPPWDAIRPKSAEFFAYYDLSVLNGYTKAERLKVERRLLEQEQIRESYDEYVFRVEGIKKACDRLYTSQKLMLGGDLAGRYLDLYRVFLERMLHVARERGRVGVLIPAAFRANAGAVGVRQLYLTRNRLLFCYGFRNSKRMFDISLGMEFCLLGCEVRHAEQGDYSFEVAFDLEDERWLDERVPAPLHYTVEFVRSSGGPHLTIGRASNTNEVELLSHIAGVSAPVSSSELARHIRFQTNPAALNATKDAFRFVATDSVTAEDPREPRLGGTLLARGQVPLHEKGTIERFDYRVQQRPRYMVDLGKCADRSDLFEQLRWYRLMGRSAIHASEAHKTVFALVPPGGLVSNSAMVEAGPGERPNAVALAALAVLNSSVFDFLAHKQVVLNLNLFILRNLRIPKVLFGTACLAHTALRLSAVDASFGTLWQEQLGCAWREELVIRSAEKRMAAVAVIDALVALSYGLSRRQYAYVLERNGTGGSDAAARLCLARFEELERIGVEAFTRKWDPHWDVALNNAPARAAIEYPLIRRSEGAVVDNLTLFDQDSP
jgi:hypothetical protein